MGFSAKQVRALKRNVDERHVRVREIDGRGLSYLEGWYAISAANRIFGFDGWNRETVESRCVLARENKGAFLAVYTAKVRITVSADGKDVIREGHGTGEGRGNSPGEAHDTGLKAAETDATKRALTTFGRPFGLELYRSARKHPQMHANLGATASASSAAAGRQVDRTETAAPACVAPEQAPQLATAKAPIFPITKPHPDDGTPIPRLSTYFGRERYHEVRKPSGELVRRAAHEATDAEKIASPALQPSRIDKSVLALPEPKRLRDKSHLKYVASQACLICGKQPADPHHLRFAQPRAIGLKVSDEFTVPLCRSHHRNLHQSTNEQRWWENFRIEPLPIACKLWEMSHQRTAPKSASTEPAAAEAQTVAGDQTKPFPVVQS
jgi:Rad52/22 family double-strand break repair protein